MLVLIGFFFNLDRNVEDVDYFYNKKYSEFARRLKLLEERYGYSMEGRHALEPEDCHDLREALLDLRYHLRRLQWYGEVNRRGFVKITKKLDKKVGAQAQKRYLETKVDPTPFASNERVFQSQDRINAWMAIITDQSKADDKASDDASSTHSTLSLKRGSTRPYLNLPTSIVTAVDDALRKDDTHVLLELLETLKATADEAGETVYSRVLRTLIQRSILHRSRAVLTLLLTRVDTLEEDDDINRRNCLHRLVISIGREQPTTDSEPAASMVLNFPPETTRFITPAAPPTLQPPRPVVKEEHMPQQLARDDSAVAHFQFLLDTLRLDQRESLMAKDLSGRTPLHYAAQYGFKVVCEVIIEHLIEWGMFDVSDGIDGPLWQDNDGSAPLHLSVVGGHPKTTRCLLDAEKENDPSPERSIIRKQVSKSSAVLALATKANFIDIVQLLVDAGVDINYQDEQGETALHVAARFCHDECAQILLDGSDDQKADTELAENTYGWTPLFIACVDGCLGVAKMLVSAGADVERFDSSGWTAKEHAALRGHLDIARCLEEVSPGPPATELDFSSSTPTLPGSESSSPPSQSSLTDRRSNAPGPTSGGSGVRTTEPIKTFGHRYLTDESMILVSLGTMDMRKPLETVSLDRIPLENAHVTQLDTSLSMVITASGAHGEPEVIDLPVQDNISTEPIVFHTTDPSKVRLLFDLVPTYAGSKEKIVGRGVALLSSIKPTVGSHRINLKGDSTVPIVAANTLEVIGSVTFNFLVITPFKHPKMSIAGNQTYWRSMSSTMVIGHRGLGKNMAGRNSLQLGENTVESFIAAANLGASYVEFDVQLTKDHVPVIYHDFLVSETGIDAPVHTMTLDQFLELGVGRYRHALPGSVKVDGKESELGPRQRSMSVGGSEYDPAELTEKIKHTRDFKKKGFKGNTRGEHIQAPFATLEELFTKIPKPVGFNIELSELLTLPKEQLYRRSNQGRQNIPCSTRARRKKWTHTQ